MIHTGMVFGVFDGLHEGHKHFLREAKKRCESLIVVIADPDATLSLKGKLPKHSWDERTSALATFDPTLTLVRSDRESGSWNVLKTHRPDTIFLGYDQDALAEALAHTGVPTEKISAHEPEQYKSRLLN